MNRSYRKKLPGTALDYFDEVAARPDIKLEFMLEPGETIFFNNCTMLHNRTAFEDHPEPERKRHLLRLWLMLDGLLVSWLCTLAIPLAIGSGAIAQPIRQPVIA